MFVTEITPFGVKLQEAIADAGISRAHVAAEAGVTEAAVRNWIRGEREPNSKYLPGIARVTGKPIAWFFEEVAA